MKAENFLVLTRSFCVCVYMFMHLCISDAFFVSVSPAVSVLSFREILAVSAEVHQAGIFFSHH